MIMAGEIFGIEGGDFIGCGEGEAVVVGLDAGLGKRDVGLHYWRGDRGVTSW